MTDIKIDGENVKRLNIQFTRTTSYSPLDTNEFIIEGVLEDNSVVTLVGRLLAKRLVKWNSKGFFEDIGPDSDDEGKESE